MSEIGPINQTHPALARIAARRAADAAQNTASGTPRVADDSAQFSPAAQLLSKLDQLPDVRQDLIDQARANIASGSYDSDAVLDATIDKLIEDL